MITDASRDHNLQGGWRGVATRLLPHREELVAEAFELRLRLCSIALVIATVIVTAVGIAQDIEWTHLATETAPILFLLFVARRAPNRLIAMLAVSAGLAGESAVLVHYTDGLIEAHFAFFVVLPLIALFQDWRPIMSAAVLVVAHHAIVGLIDPTSVYNHPAAQNDPLLWGAIHGSFVLAEVSALMTLWRFSAQDHRATRRALDALTTAQTALEHRASHDPLTNLGNRALLLNTIGGALDDQQAVQLYVIDIDHFQLVNETFGYDIGDQVLLAVADELRRTIRPTDLLVRVGADEFVVLTEADASTDLAMHGKRFLAAFRRPLLIDEQEFPISVSVGAAASHGADQHPITDPTMLLRNANSAMNRAKTAGRDGVAVFDEVVHAETAQRLELKRELHQAVADEAFELYYQPVVDMANGGWVGVEALIRWHHPERGRISPDDFIPLAEDSGIIIPIGEWVLWEACLQVAKWNQQHGVDLDVAINLSARQLVSPTLTATVSDVLDTTGIDPSRICFEVTESALIDNPELAIGNLQALRELGLELALDDFGTRYASLTYLRTLPVTLIKIDRSFTAGLGVDPKDDTIIESTIALAHGLGLRVVAEGIERTDQYAMLCSFECDYGQGYHFGKAMPADEVIEAFFACLRPQATGSIDPGVR